MYLYRAQYVGLFENSNFTFVDLKKVTFPTTIAGT